MKKIVKILSLVLALVVACSCLTGCFVKYDKERDFRQVVAKVDSYTIVNPEDETQEVQTKEFKFYKYQLANFINSYYASYMNAGYTIDQLIDEIIQSVLTQQIVINTGYAYKQFGLIRWSQFEEDEVTAYKYQSLDSYLEEMKKEIMEERGESYVSGGISPEDTSSSGSTTYPVYNDDTITGYETYSKDQLVNECMLYLVPANASDEVQAAKREEYNDLVPYALIKLLNDYFKTSSYYVGLTSEELKAEATALGLTVSGTDYQIMCAIDDYYYNERKSRAYDLTATKVPGVFGDDQTRSLENSAMERTLTLIKEQTDSIYNISDEEKKAIDEAWDYVYEVKNTKGISYTYTALAESAIMEHLAGKSYREQILVNLLEEYIESQIGVSVKEVEDRYSVLLAYQQDAYNASIDYYVSDMESGNMVLYHPVSGYYFVKHILVPFSETQKAQITNYQGTAIGQQYKNQEEYRNYLATQITGYEHKDGENYGNALTVDEIMNDVKKSISESSYGEKDKTFTKLMYKYSTDTGGFSQKYGYKEQVSFAEGEKSSFVPEFAEACVELYEKGELYALSEPVVTDYGVHILMLTRTTEVEVITGLYGYASASDNRTVYQTIEDELYNAKLNEYFTKWQNQEITSNYDKSVSTFADRYSNILEEMAAK